RALVLWRRRGRRVPARGRLRRPHPQGSQSGRPAGAGTRQVRAGHQPEDRRCAWARRATDSARPRRRGDRVTRRAFIAALVGAAAWPHAARAQQGERMGRIGVLFNLAENDPNGRGFMAAFRQGLQELGWVGGRNARIDIRWGTGRNDRYPEYAAELVGVAPDVVLAATTPAAV